MFNLAFERYHRERSSVNRMKLLQEVSDLVSSTTFGRLLVRSSERIRCLFRFSGSGLLLVGELGRRDVQRLHGRDVPRAGAHAAGSVRAPADPAQLVAHPQQHAPNGKCLPPSDRPLLLQLSAASSAVERGDSKVMIQTNR